jgi:hypothetical protein
VPSYSDLASNHTGLLTQGYCRSCIDGTAANEASVTVTTIRAKEAYNCFVQETLAFNAAKISYHLTLGPNSNSYVRTLLDHCKVPVVKPPSAVLTLGWDVSISFER